MIFDQKLYRSEGLAWYVQSAERVTPTINNSLPSKAEGKKKSFSDKHRIKEFTTTKLALQEMLIREKEKVIIGSKKIMKIKNFIGKTR